MVSSCDIASHLSLTALVHLMAFFSKTNKASMMHYVLTDTAEEVPYPKDTFFIQDGNALFHTLTNLPPTFGDICLQILDQMVAKKNFIFSTDSYHADSIKAQERIRRGMGEKFLVLLHIRPRISSCFLTMSLTRCSSASYC